MKVRKTGISSGSLIENYLPTDYSDVYACTTDCEKEITPDDIMVNFWTDFPQWVSALFKLRNFLVKFVGLKGAENDNIGELEKCIRMGETYGFASVPAKCDNETVLLLSDRHLNAYISVHVDCKEKQKTISAATLVQFKNRLGRIYFFIIQPFHGAIVRSMLKRAMNNVVGLGKDDKIH